MKFFLLRFAVEGHSMEPTLSAGDRVLVVRSTKLRRGDLVAFQRGTRVLLKRVKAEDATGVIVLGDHASDSEDSRTFGAVPREAVIGRVVFRY